MHTFFTLTWLSDLVLTYLFQIDLSFNFWRWIMNIQISRFQSEIPTLLSGYKNYKGSTHWYIGKVDAYGGNFVLRECDWQFYRKRTWHEERSKCGRSLSPIISVHGCQIRKKVSVYGVKWNYKEFGNHVQ